MTLTENIHDENPLDDYLIRLNYPINEKYFVVLSFIASMDRDEFGFLIPIKSKFIKNFDLKKIVKQIAITKQGNNEYLVRIVYPNNQGSIVYFEKSYSPESDLTSSGKLITINLFFAFFPLFKVLDHYEYNDFYKIMVVDDEQTYTNIQLCFFNEHYSKVDNAENIENVNKITRNVKSDINNGGSYFYQTNFPYSFIEVCLYNEDIEPKIRGLIIPKWKEVQLGTINYDISVDLSKDQIDIHLFSDLYQYKKPSRLTIGEEDQQVILFNKIDQSEELTLTEKYETWNSYLETRLISRQKHEFIPSIIGEGENPTYKFPIRTAVSTSTNYSATSTDLLGNINISFIFEKDVHRSDEMILTNLKYVSGDNDICIIFSAVLKQLLLMVRNKVLLNQGDPAKSKLIWYYDSQVSENDLSELSLLYNSIWHEVFHTSTSSYPCSRVCAAYYYSKNKNLDFKTRSSLTLLINSEFSEILYRDSKRYFQHSVDFGDNAIWNPGLEKRHKTLEGIFIKYGLYFISDIIKNMAASDKVKINTILNIFNSQHEQGIQSENIFNLYFTWDHIFKFTKTLKKDPKIQFLILFHFCSIIYYSLNQLNLMLFKMPSRIYVSCRYQRYLNIIEYFNRPLVLNKFISDFGKKIFELKNKNKKSLEIMDMETEAISMGGFYYSDTLDKHKKMKQIMLKNQNIDKNKAESKTITYTQVDDTLKESVSLNVNRFIVIFFSLYKEQNFGKKIGITLNEPLEKYKEYLTDNSYNFLELGLNKRFKNVNLTDQVSEPLFFYPIITMIYELSKKFYNNNDK